MTSILTTAQMKQTEAAADRAGQSYKQMMLRAGEGAARAICGCRSVYGMRGVIVCGRGNNGGDGYVVACLLASEGAQITIIMVGEPPKSDEGVVMHRRAVESGIAMVVAVDNPRVAERLCTDADFIVDALLGTGFSGTLREEVAALCRIINQAKRPVYALDLPSGVDADTGEADPDAVRAVCTIVFDSYKPGHFLQPGRELCGQLSCVDIGITEHMRRGIDRDQFYVDEEFVTDCLPVRPAECHKGDFGKLLAVVGSKRYMGAALLSVSAALRSGTGYVTLAAPEPVCPVLLPTVPACVMEPCSFDEEGGLSVAALPVILKRLERSTALLLGCGLGNGEGACRVIEEALAASRIPVILDADGINAAARDITIIKKRHCDLVMTPHLAEFARLLGVDLAQAASRRLRLGRAFAQEQGVTLLLKGAVTTVFTPTGDVYYSASGNPGMARAGSGDVLAGIVGALLAQGLAPECAAACGAWIHGRAGSLAAAKYSQSAMLPQDIVEQLGGVFTQCGR